jgi:hypothetical protein
VKTGSGLRRECLTGLIGGSNRVEGLIVKNGFDAYTLNNITVPLSLPRFGGRRSVTPFLDFWEW